MDRLTSPFRPFFRDFFASIQTNCLICSPYIGYGPVAEFVGAIRARGLEETVRVQVVTDISAQNLVQNSTDLNALIYLCDAIKQTKICYLPQLHAKVYVADDNMAIVTSANFTTGGAIRNREYGVRYDDSGTVQSIARDIAAYAALGAPVSAERLERLQEPVSALRDAIREEQQTIRGKSRTLDVLTRRAEDDLIRLRVASRTVNAIFSDTLIYLLEQEAMTTVDLNTATQQIHPDLCDDGLDRVIDGVSYGKKWKHQVRSAQVSLERQGRIIRDKTTKLWHLLPPGSDA